MISILFDYNFLFLIYRNLPSDFRDIQDPLVLFSVKDKDMLGYNNQYIGEAYLHFKDIDKSSQAIENLPQMRLCLCRPTDLSQF